MVSQLLQAFKVLDTAFLFLSSRHCPTGIRYEDTGNMLLMSL